MNEHHDEARALDAVQLDAEQEESFARCSAALLIGKALAPDPDLRWVYEEAARIAAGPPRRPIPTRWLTRLASPALAWGVAAVASIVAAAALMNPTASRRETESARPPSTAVADDRPAPAARAAAYDVRVAAVGPSPVVVLPGRVVVDAQSLAVMPFEFEGGVAEAAEPEEDGDAASAPVPRASALASKLYDSVVRALEATPGVYVAQQEAVMPYAGTDLDVDQVASQLGVRGIVEGRLEAEADRMRISLSLTDAASDDVIWQATVVRPVDALSDVGADVAADLASALASANGAPERAPTY